MNNLFVRNIIRFVVLTLLQLLVLNNLQISGYVTPYLYVLFLIQMPFRVPTAGVLVSCFVMGVTLDVFEHTGGIHAAALTLLAMTRPLIFDVLAPSEGYEDLGEPNIWDLGMGWYVSYTMIIVLIHHFVLFFLEIFSFQNILFTLSRGLISSLLTLFFIYVYAFFFHKPQKGLIH